MEEISVYNQILATALGMGWLQWLAFIFSIIYVILAAKENPFCWPVGLVGVSFAFFVYLAPEVKLYSEAILQIFYAIMSVYGWWIWTRTESSTSEKLDSYDSSLEIHQWPLKYHLRLLVVGLVVAVLWGRFTLLMFGASLPYIDAVTTAFSLIATYMVTQKVLENWLYWIVIDVLGIFVNFHKGLYLFAILFFIYTIVAVIGYFNWKKEMNPFNIKNQSVG